MTGPSRSRCSHVVGCELFPKFGLRATLGVWKTLYCEAQFEACARYRLAQQGRPVPATLLPNGKDIKPGLSAWIPARPSEG